MAFFFFFLNFFKKREHLENTNTNMKTNQHEQWLIRFTLPLLNLPLLNIERRRVIACEADCKLAKKGCRGSSRRRAERKGEDGNRSHWPRKSLPLWPARLPSAASSSPAFSSSCCASADCYQPHTSPSIRVRARAKRSACRQPIGRDGPSLRLLANGHPDAPDVTHTALSALRARQARGRSGDRKTRSKDCNDVPKFPKLTPNKQFCPLHFKD